MIKEIMVAYIEIAAHSHFIFNLLDKKKFQNFVDSKKCVGMQAVN